MRMTGKPGFFWGATLLCFLSAPALSVAGGLDAPVADQAKPAPAPRASIKWTKVDRDGTVSTIEKEVPPDSIRTGGGMSTQGNDPPGAPETPDPPAATQPPEVTHVAYHSERNGWERDTRYERDVTWSPNGESPMVSPWRLIDDHVKWKGCGSGSLPGVSCNPF